MTTQNTNPTDNIFSGLKVVDFASFIAGPGAAVILSDFGADVVKVEPPKGEMWRIGQKIPPQPNSDVPYPFQLANRHKRSLALDLKSPEAGEILERLVKWADVFIVNTPHPARKKLKLAYEDVVQWNPRLVYADITGYGEKGPDAALPGFDLTAFWARSGLLSMTRDAGATPTWPVAGSGDNATAVALYAAVATALYRREKTGKGSYVSTSLLASGIWSASVFIQAALAGASFYGLHDRAHPANAALNVYRSSDGTWFLLVATPDKVPAILKAMGQENLLTDPRFSDPTKLAANRPQLTAILDDIFGSQSMAHWNEVFSAVQVQGVTKVTAKRAPGIGEHNDEVLKELGFSASEVAGLYTSGVVTKPTQPVAAATKPGANPATASKPTSTAVTA